MTAAAQSIPQRVLDLAGEYRETRDPERGRQLEDEAYRALIEARITDIGEMVRIVREAFEEGT